jgi:hypothetical protein
MKGNAIHDDVNSGGRGSGEGPATERELFFGADSGVVAFPNAAGAEEFVEESDDDGLGAVHALCQGLENQRIGILIDD